MELKTTENFTEDELLHALEAMDRLWAGHRVPEELERHYFLYWFAVHQGDPARTAEAFEVHPNTVRFHFQRFGFSEQSENLLGLWRELAEKNKKASFELNFFKFHQACHGQNKMSFHDHKILVRLWKAGFPFTAIGPHYMLWALRNRKSKKWVHKKLGYSSHHCMRVLASILDPRTANGRWLLSLKPTRDEIYARPRPMVVSRT